MLWDGGPGLVQEAVLPGCNVEMGRQTGRTSTSGREKLRAEENLHLHGRVKVDLWGSAHSECTPPIKVSLGLWVSIPGLRYPHPP